MNATLSLSLDGPIVILTGAGFSKSVGLPLQRELLEGVVPPDIIRIHNFFMGRPLDASADLEEFLSSIDFDDMIASKKERSQEPLNSQTYLSGFAAFLFDRLHSMARLPQETKHQFWKKVAVLADVSDTWITLNWDTLIEIQLWALGHRIRFHGRDKRFKRVLKLHGSIDWYKPTSELPELFDSDLFVKVFRGYVRYKPLSEEPNFLMIPEKIAHLFNKIPPAIVAPTHLKALPSAEFRAIWAAATHALAFAKHIVIIGYSLPPSDTLTRLLLSNSLRNRLRIDAEDQPRVTVIDPDPTGVVRSRYVDLFGDPIEFLQSPFLDVDFDIRDR